ncbi:MAG: T9SS type A sorting domain-containing protein [Candidatus Zixiibacteriota bacterium]
MTRLVRLAICLAIIGLCGTPTVGAQNPDAFCDGFESGLGGWTPFHSTPIPQIVSTPAPHSGNSALKFQTCWPAVYRTDFAAAEGSYSAWLYQTNTYSQHSEFIIQSDFNGSNWLGSQNYVLIISASGTPGGGQMLLTRRKNDIQTTVAGPKAVQFTRNEWVRIYIIRESPNVIRAGYERANGFRDEIVYADPDPIMAAGKFILLSCGQNTDNAYYWDDVCYDSRTDDGSRSQLALTDYIRAWTCNESSPLYDAEVSRARISITNTGTAPSQPRDLFIRAAIVDDAGHEIPGSGPGATRTYNDLQVPSIAPGASEYIELNQLIFPRQSLFSRLKVTVSERYDSALDDHGTASLSQEYFVNVQANPHSLKSCLNAIGFGAGFFLGVHDWLEGFLGPFFTECDEDLTVDKMNFAMARVGAEFGIEITATLTGVAKIKNLLDALAVVRTIVPEACGDWYETAAKAAIKGAVAGGSEPSGSEVCGVIAECPIDLALYDSLGHRIIVLHSGEVISDLGSAVGLKLEDLQTILASTPSNENEVRIVGRAEGVARVSLLQPRGDTGVLEIVFGDLVCADGSVATIERFGPSSRRYSLRNDIDDDGDVDQVLLPVVTSDSGEIEVVVVTAHGESLYGAAVNIYDAADRLIAELTTNEVGKCTTEKLMIGEYSVITVPPLGFQATRDVVAVALDGGIFRVEFILSPEPAMCASRTRSHWSQQLSRALKPSAPSSGQPGLDLAKGGVGSNETISRADFARYVGLIAQHFNGNRLNPIEEYTVTQPATQFDSLNTLLDLLNLKPKATGEHMLKRLARGDLVALMLNVVSGRIHQADAVSGDGNTVSQALTYCDMLINDPNCPVGDIPNTYMPWYDRCCELKTYIKACFILGLINVGVHLPNGAIPDEVLNIAFKGADISIPLPTEVDLMQNYPNPFNAGTTISYTVASESHVTLAIYNLLGQKVADLVDADQGQGAYSVEWNGRDSKGSEVASGIYLYRLQVGELVTSKKMTLLR